MASAAPGPGQPFFSEAVLELLATGEIDVQGQLARSSNYTFLVRVKREGAQVFAVYKPRRGERPLWDFPHGTLAQREVAAYVVSVALGWKLVPPTVFRDGPIGPGMVQLYIEADPRENYFTLRERSPAQFQRVALFDAVINNADRKAGHCLRDSLGRIWAIDHGVSFHEEPKLRTVIWEFAGMEIAAGLMHDLAAFREGLGLDAGAVTEALRVLLNSRELDALGRRADQLIQAARFPFPNRHERHIPWPPV